MSSPAIQKTRRGIAAGKLGGGGTAAQPSIVFSDPQRDEPHVSRWTLSVLESLMSRAGVKRLYITSTYRSPADQAHVMQGNLTGKKSMYGGHGRRVETVARNIVLMDQVGLVLSEAIGKLPGVQPTSYKPHTRDEIVAQMAAEIERLEHQHGQGCVSRHQLDPVLINVLDIAVNAITPKKAVDGFIAVLTASTWIDRIGLPKGSKATHRKHFVETQPCIHLEIPQPVEAAGAGRFGATA
jgi:hypothetical protein